jgi:hypothetical protein
MCKIGPGRMKTDRVSVATLRDNTASLGIRTIRERCSFQVMLWLSLRDAPIGVAWTLGLGAYHFSDLTSTWLPSGGQALLCVSESIPPDKMYQCSKLPPSLNFSLYA